MSKNKKNYLYNLLLTLANLLYPIVSFPYVSRILGPSGIGKVQFVLTFAQYFSLVAALGIPIYGIREIAKAKSNELHLSKTFSELFFLYMASSLVLGTLYILLISNINRFSPDYPFYLVASSLVLLSFSSMDWFYCGLEEFSTIALRSVFIKIVSLICLYTFVCSTKDIYLYLLICLFSQLGNNVINILTISRKVRLRIKGIDLVKHYKPLLLVFSTTLASSMYTLFDVLLLGFMSDDNAVGLYTAGVKLCKVAIPFVTSLSVVLMPQVAIFINEDRKEDFVDVIKKSYSFLMLLSIPVSIGLCLLSEDLIILFSGKEFIAAAPSMRILAFLPFVIGLGYLFGIQILTATGRDKDMFISVSVGMGAGILLNILLIPIIGIEGASIANLLSEIFVTLTYYMFVKNKYNLELGIRPILEATISSAFFLPIIYGIKCLFESDGIVLLICIPACTVFYFSFQLLVFRSQILITQCNIFAKLLHSKTNA